LLSKVRFVEHFIVISLCSVSSIIRQWSA